MTTQHYETLTPAQRRKKIMAEDKFALIKALGKLGAHVTNSYWAREVFYVTFTFGKGGASMDAVRKALNVASMGTPFTLVLPFGDAKDGAPGTFSAKYLYRMPIDD